MLKHGGRLREAATRYGIALESWLDLSAALNPNSYTPSAISSDAWFRLPENEDGLESAARLYYGNPNLLVLPGSQAAIQTLPRLFQPHRVAVLTPSYAEHAHAWRLAGHHVEEIAADQLELCAGRYQTLVLCNPNNPDATVLAKERLLHLARAVDRLIVDEAFIDPVPEDTLTPWAGTDIAPHLIVLRSLGKFFGLAGARVGFAFAKTSVLESLADALGPWPVSGPSREVATAALMDTEWQAQARLGLAIAGKRLTKLLTPLATLSQSSVQSQSLFAYMTCINATSLADFFASHGILIRRFDDAVRFGLPRTECQWQRLESIVTLYCQRSTVNTFSSGTR